MECHHLAKYSGLHCPECASIRVSEIIAARETNHGGIMPSYYVKTGLAGYGPDLDPEDESVDLESLDYVLHDELNRCADYAEETAHALAESGDYEGAWREHIRSDSLAIQAANFDPKRRDAPLYQGDLPKWLNTVILQLEQTFPDGCIDIGNHERLYVWEVTEEEGGISLEGQALGHRYVMGNVNAYCPKCSEEHGITVLDCDYDLDK